MGRGLIKLEGPEGVRYLEWSTIVDAPITYGLTLDQLREHIRFRDGESGVEALPERLARAEKSGTSFHDLTLGEVLACNRAGPDEAALDEEGLWARYCSAAPIEGKSDEDRCDAELEERCLACSSPVSFFGDRLCRACEDQEEE